MTVEELLDKILDQYDIVWAFPNAHEDCVKVIKEFCKQEWIKALSAGAGLVHGWDLPAWEMITKYAENPEWLKKLMEKSNET